MESLLSGELVLASANEGKLAELRALLGAGVQVRSLGDFSLIMPEETGQSFQENALLKARFVADSTGLPAIADDSGLCVDWLGGAPGIYSARYAGANASDGDNIDKLLAELQQVADPNRGARFVCSLALVHPNNRVAPILCDGIWHGKILHAASGTGGFGYDPIFQPDGHSLSAAQLNPQQKNRFSHRGRAMAKLAGRLSPLQAQA